MNNPVVFYHLWPVGEWERINEEIFSSIVDSGLSDRISLMHICVNSDIDFSEISLHGIPSDKVQFHRIPDTQSEWPTLDILYNTYLNEPNTPILYMHCKGARFTSNDAIYNAVTSWTRGMTYFNVSKWRKCLNLLSQGRHSVGIRVERLPVAHYSGNFWWINSSSLRLLLNPKTQNQTYQNRHGAEFWIGRLGLNYLYDTDLKRLHFTYGNVIGKEQYETYGVNEKSICMYGVDSSNISWLDSTGIDYEVYVKGNGLNFNSSVACYFTYIVNNYNNLADYVYFLKSDSNRQIPNLHIILKNRYIKFQSFGSLRVTDTNKGLPNHPGLDIEATWNKYLDEECPSSFTFTAGSVFGVSSKEIKKYPIEFYQKVLQNMEKKDVPVEDYCFERMWESFFTLTLKNKPKENLGSGVSLNLLNNVEVERPRYTTGDTYLMWEESYKEDTILEDLVRNIENKKYIIYFKGDINHDEFQRFLSLDFDKRNSQYTEHKFNGWKCFILDTEYYTSNVTKKKKIIQPLVQHIKEFMLSL